MLVLAVVLMLAVAVVAVLNMSLNTDVVATKLEDSTRTIHSVDGAMEKAVNAVRNDPAACVAGSKESYGDYDVECDGPAVAGNPSRVVKLFATIPGSDDLVGAALVRYTDRESGLPLPGYTVEVCDWLLGGALESDLKGCAA